ncbi:MAG: TraR/DksA C4-type zinc finger protein [Burkholderiaceae bacterium]
MSGLTKEKVDEFTQKLEALRARLLEQIQQDLSNLGRDDLGQLAGLVHDTKDQSLSDRMSQLDSTVEKMHRDALTDVDISLQRLSAGEFTRCVDCDGEIGLARLTALPTTRRCISCETTYESLSAVRGGLRS